jgi:hypothetical protein
MSQPIYSFTFIIGYRHNIARLNNLRRVLDWINGFSGVEVILVEQDKHPKINHLNLRAKYVFTKTNLPYNRSWAFNVGLKYSTSNLIVFGDSDLIMHPDDFINGLKSLDQYEMLSPYNSVLDLNPQESTLPLEEIVKISRPGRGETDNQKINISGGISMFKKDAIYKIAGWSEDFIGWGGEDDFQTIKVQHFLKWTELKAKCYHLYHDKAHPDQKWYQRNLNLLNKFANLSADEVRKTLGPTLPKIGMKNRYDTFVE